MTWAWWLAVPVGATTLAAVLTWLRAFVVRRSARPLTTQEAMREHGAYLDALVLPARNASRPSPRVCLEPEVIVHPATGGSAGPPAQPRGGVLEHDG